MSGAAGPPDRPPVRPRRVELAIALFVTVLWGSVVFEVDGLLSVVLDRDPIGAAVSPYYGILALVLAAVLLWVVLAGTARSPTPWFGTLAAAVGVYLALVASALPVGLVLVGQQAGSPFVIAAALLAALAVFATWVVMRRWGPSE